MNCLMIAAIEYNEFEGISKKIINQAKALSNGGTSILLCLEKKGIQMVTFSNCEFSIAKSLDKFRRKKRGIGDRYLVDDLLNEADKINLDKIDLVYIRHMVPSFTLIRLLSKFRRNKIRIIYEIPTYPYYHEQLLISKNKLKTLLKLCIESFFWPFIYQNVNNICVIKCKSKAKMWKKMISIPNGYDGFIIEEREYKVDSIKMVGVGTIYPYHGYDMIIDAMDKCGCKTSDGAPIYFDIVGESKTIDNLREIVILKKLEKNIIFWGPLKGEKLKELYLSSNLGVGTLRLSMRKADIDTAIKNIEYFAYGLPVITSGKVFNILDEKVIYCQNEKEDIDFNLIFQFLKEYSNHPNQTISFAKACSWTNILSSILFKKEKCLNEK